MEKSTSKNSFNLQGNSSEVKSNPEKIQEWMKNYNINYFNTSKMQQAAGDNAVNEMLERGQLLRNRFRN